MSRKNGFTLIEILLVIALFLIIASSSTIVGLQSFKHSTVRNEERLIVSILQKARSEAMGQSCTGTCDGGVDQGVHIANAGITIFQGDTFDSNDPENETFPHLADNGESGLTDIVFTSSGNTLLIPNLSSSIVLNDPEGGVMSISVGNEGQISWSN